MDSAVLAGYPNAAIADYRVNSRSGSRDSSQCILLLSLIREVM